MNIIIYNPNSRGGNFDYALRLSQEFVKYPSLTEFAIVLPVNSVTPSTGEFHKILLSDLPPSSNKIVSRVYFLWRSIINPFKFYNFIKNKSNGYVIFNDFDQATSVLWSFVFRRLKVRFVFSVILHDPDRDNYFRVRSLSRFSMQRVMSIMNVAFYHEILPERPYYPQRISYHSIPHGLYDKSNLATCDAGLRRRLSDFKKNDKLISAIGNIRFEKNYDVIITALKEIEGLKLLIYGMPSNSSVRLSKYRELVMKEGLSDRVLVIEKHFDDSKLAAIAENTDAFIMYYANSFKSQSGILNLLAPFKKMLLVSKTESPLSLMVSKYNLGLMARPDSKEDLVEMLRSFKQSEYLLADWTGYFNYASWKNNVSSIMGAFEVNR